MGIDRVACDVTFASDALKTGEFANAIRIVHDGGDDYFVDFCVYSTQENVAKVVSRIRVSRGFLPSIQHRVHEALHEPVTVNILMTNKIGDA